MRPLLPIVLLCGACGDNLIVDPSEEGPPHEPTFEEAQVLFAPDVCSVRSWSTLAFPDRDVDLSVVPTPTGAAVFTVERAGGPLRGFTLDGRGEIDSKLQGSVIRDDQPFTAVSAAFIDERLITAAAGVSGMIEIDMIRPDLGAHASLSSVRGTLVADAPMTHARADRFATIGDANGLTGIRFDTAWQTAGTEPLATTKVQSMTATRYLEDTIVAWSSDSQCSMTRVSAQRTSTRNFPCLNSHIAVSGSTRRGYMVYEEGADKVMISEIRIGGESEIANTRLLVDGARAPKIVYDGVRFWVSYINARQDVVIGYMDTQNNLVSMALEGTQPFGDGYELAFVSGAVWVFSVDGAGAGAHRLCLRPVR